MNVEMRNAVVFGAGNIGRGFLGQLFYESGFATTFVDVVPRLIEEISRRGAYPLRIVNGGVRDLTIGNVDAVALDSEEAVARLSRADIAATAVGVRHLPGVAPTVARALKRRFASGPGRPLDIVLCENLLDAPAAFRAQLESHLGDPGSKNRLSGEVGLVASVVSRMVPVLTEEQRAEDPLLVVVEPYCALPVDALAFRGGDPGITGFQLSDNIHAYEERKLFTHNMGHAVCAYLGFLAGHTWTWQAVEDPAVRSVLDGAFAETGEALMRRHGFAAREQRDHEQDLATRFANRRLGDTVARVGRDPLRKLGPQDRLVGAARLCLAQGIQPRNVVRALAAALRFAPDDDESASTLQRMIHDDGARAVLTRVCGIDPADPLHGMALAAYAGDEGCSPSSSG